jgi:acyl-CoA synthetase (AMP-forming)/AMP-acid ligase II
MQLSPDLPALIAFEDDAENGAKPAIRFRLGPVAQHRDFTYGELRRAAIASAAALLELGARPGERMALLMPSSPRLIATYYGALYAGLIPSIIATPTAKMDPEKYRRNVVAVVTSLDASLLVTDAASADRLGAAVGRARVIDPTHSDGATTLDGEIPSLAPNPRREGTAFIQFSGGTTGTQKSVPISYEHLYNQLASCGAGLGLRPDDRIVSWLPLYHDMGLIACLLMPFVYRLSVTLFAPMEWVMDPRPFLESIGKDRSTHVWLPNFAFAFLARKSALPTATPLDLSSLRAVVNCSEPVRAESIDAFTAAFVPHGLPLSSIHTSYGMAEATFAISQSKHTDPPRRLPISIEAIGQGRLVRDAESPRTLVSCGPLLAGMKARIMTEAGEPAAPDHVGEIWIHSNFLMEDYLRSPEDSAPRRRSFTPDGWLKTGDLGAFHEGHLYVTGRKKDVIIIGGVNLYPEDLEAVVSTVAGVHAGRVVALGIDDAALGTERLVVVGELDEGIESEQIAAIEAEARKVIVAGSGVAPYKVFLVPPHWVVKSTAGKVARPDTLVRVLERWDDLVAAQSA